MTTDVEICSAALVLVGDKPIASMTESTSRARDAAALYPIAVRATLRSHPWNCATRRVILSPDFEAPEFGWRFRFQKPGDWLRTIAVGEDGFEVDHKMEGPWILSNDDPMRLRYVWHNRVESTWDSLLVEAVTLTLAAKLAKPVAGSDSTRDTLLNELSALMKQARAIDGQEDPPETLGNFGMRARRG